MKKSILILIFLSFGNIQAQLNETIIGKWKLNQTVSTEFTDTDMANQQVTEKQAKYNYLENSLWHFKKEGKLEVKLADGKIENGGYSANEDRFIIIFNNQEIEEFNTTNIIVEKKEIKLSFGRAMTKLNFVFSKK